MRFLTFVLLACVVSSQGCGSDQEVSNEDSDKYQPVKLDEVVGSRWSGSAHVDSGDYVGGWDCSLYLILLDKTALQGEPWRCGVLASGQHSGPQAAAVAYGIGDDYRVGADQGAVVFTDVPSKNYFTGKAKRVSETRLHLTGRLFVGLRQVDIDTILMRVGDKEAGVEGDPDASWSMMHKVFAEALAKSISGDD